MSRSEDQLPIDQITASLDRAVGSLVQQQKSDGSWSGFCPGGPFSTCMTLIVEGYLGILSKKNVQEGVRYLRGQQRDDGAFEDYPYAAEGSLDATAVAMAALRTAGVDETDPMVIKAKLFVDSHGGYQQCMEPNKVLLVLAGQMSASTLAKPFLAFRLLPGVDKLACKRMAVFMWVIFNAFSAITAGLRNPGQRSIWRHPIRTLAAARFERYFTEVQCPDGNWNGVIYTTLLGILTLHFAGVPNSDGRIRRGLDKVRQWKVYSDRGMEVSPFGADIWNTSVVVRALLLCGADVDSAPVRQGLDYLVRSQPEIAGPRHWQNPPSGVPIIGGWPFMPANPFSPDLDSTGDVLWTLGLALQKGAGEEVRQHATRAMDWLVPMQNPEGGWSGYTHGQRDKPAGPIFTKPMVQPTTLWGRLRMTLKPPPEMLDCANADITGRVLCTLKAHGYQSDHPAVEGGVRFLRTQQWSNDLWWGRWEVNYLFGTSYALSGLAAAGIDPGSDEIQRASNTVLQHQNSDGGWGESIDSYSDPSLAGTGPSSAALTGRLLAALCDIGQTQKPAAAQAADYLVSQQQADGSWTDQQTMWVVMPPAMFYINPIYTQYLAIEGLVHYRDTIGGPD